MEKVKKSMLLDISPDTRSSFCTKETAIDKTSEWYRLISGGKTTDAKFQRFWGACKLFCIEGNKEEEVGMTLLTI